MILDKIVNIKEERSPLRPADIPEPEPVAGEVLIEVSACGVCHTELDEIEGRTPPPRLPVIPGHQVIGRVVVAAAGAERFAPGDRVGVAWIASACGKCSFCTTGRENLCPDFKATGRDIDGGYARMMKIDEGFAYPVPDKLSDFEAAPLLCAGAIGYRSLRLTGVENGDLLGLTGFGASGHLVLKLAAKQLPESDIFVFTRSSDEQEFARELGAAWAGDTNDTAPEQLKAIIDTTPVWKPAVSALKSLAPGGRLVINAIRKEDADKDYLFNLDYSRDLWLEKEIKSVANVTRRDVSDFLALALEHEFKPELEIFPLEDANRALVELKEKRARGAKVLDCSPR